MISRIIMVLLAHFPNGESGYSVVVEFPLGATMEDCRKQEPPKAPPGAILFGKGCVEIFEKPAGDPA